MGRDKQRAARNVREAGSKQPAQRKVFSSASTQTTMADLASVPGALAAIIAVAEAGEAITISQTSDGGAWSISLLTGGTRPEKAYARTQEELDSVFAEIVRAYADG